MKIETLFPEYCNLYGDNSNIKYLKKSLTNAIFYDTSMEDIPHFIKEDIDFIYIGCMTEHTQELVIKKLLPYVQRIKECIENNVVFLVTGNAMEIFGKYIEKEDGTKIPGLNIFDVYSKRDIMHRHNSLFLGNFEDIEIVGFKSQFTMMYGNNENNAFIKVEKGIGINKKSRLEGIHEHNFFATYLLGPILIMNPLFTKKLLKILNIENEELIFYEEGMNAYKERLEELKRITFK